MGEEKKVTEVLFFFFFSVEVFSLRSWLGFFLSFVFIQIRNKGFYYRLSMLLRSSGKVFYVIRAFWIKMPQYMKDWASFFPLFWCSLIPNGSLIIHKYCRFLVIEMLCFLVMCKLNKGKGLFVPRHRLVNASCQLWDSDRAFGLFFGWAKPLSEPAKTGFAKGVTIQELRVKQWVSRLKVKLSRGRKL